MAKTSMRKRGHPPARPEANAQAVIHNALSENPEVQLVLEIATRARDLAATEHPILMDDSTGTFTATAFTSQIHFH